MAGGGRWWPSRPCLIAIPSSQFLVIRGAYKVNVRPNGSAAVDECEDDEDVGTGESQRSVAVASTGAIGLVDAFVRESEAWEAQPPSAGATLPPLVPAGALEACEALARHYQDRVRASSKIGRAANLIMVAHEHWGVDDRRTNTLIDAYNSALDEGKSGEGMKFPYDLEGQLNHYGWPAHLRAKAGSKHVRREDESMSVLGKMWMRRKEPPPGTCDEVFFDPHLHLPDHLYRTHFEMYTKWAGRVSEYGREVVQLTQRYDQRVDEGKSHGWGREYKALLASYREQLLSEYSEAARELDEMRAADGECRRLLCEAAMLAKVVYDRADRKMQTGGYPHMSSGSGLAFAWNVAGDYLCHLKAQGVNRSTGRPLKAVDADRLCSAVAARRRAAAAEELLEVAADETSVELEELSCCV